MSKALNSYPLSSFNSSDSVYSNSAHSNHSAVLLQRIRANQWIPYESPHHHPGLLLPPRPVLDQLFRFSVGSRLAHFLMSFAGKKNETVPNAPQQQQGTREHFPVMTRCRKIVRGGCSWVNQSIPLVVLTQPHLPRVTEYLLQLTFRFLPGASPPFTPIPPLNNAKRRVTNVDQHLTIIASTHQFSTSLDVPLANMEHVDAAEQQQLLVAPQASKHRFVIQIALIVLFSGLLLMCLLLDGYVAQTALGEFPTSVGKRASFWKGSANQAKDSIDCGENGLECRPFATDYWFGLHCLGGMDMVNQFSLVRGGQGNYTADSHICASAAHAGVIDSQLGGCFEVRLSGARNSFVAEESNGIHSKSFGWFPRSVQYRATPGSRFCGNTFWPAALIVCVAFVVFYLVWRIDAILANWVLVQFGFAYAGYRNNKGNGEFLVVTNTLMERQFTLIASCYMLFHVLGPAFCPDPTRFPIEAILFSGVFFIFIHLHDLEMDLNLDGFVLSSSLFSGSTNLGYLTFFALLIVVLAVGLLAQVKILYQAGLGKQYLVGTVLAVLLLLLLALPTKPQLSLHFHHFFLGLCICALARGQRWFSMGFQAIGLALFVEGVALYNIAPLFDVNGLAPTIGYQSYPTPALVVSVEDAVEIRFEPVVFTSALFLDNTTIELEWALPSELAYGWDCEGEVGYYVPEIFRTMYELSLNEGEPLPVKADQLFYVLQNGVLQPSDEPRYARRFVKHNIDPEMFATEALVFDVVLVDDRVSTLVKLPMPFPMAPDVPYHAHNASLCDRLMGIYSRVQDLTQNHTQLVWWKDE
ncbi:hypothetical protein BASA81_006445 [Batrachochytrium salamandrivorans]|nr:hypothetical protein BASA81_006445 [Batrachochytrium salamandrivorans]